MKWWSVAVRSVVPVALLAITLSGCGGDSSDAVSESTKSRNLAPVASQASQDAAVKGIAALGLDLLDEKEGNAVVAPYSASLSLARLQAGANGETATAIISLTRFTGARNEIYATLNQLSLGIDSRLAAASLGSDTSGTYSAAWSQARYGYKISYLDLLAEHFGLKPNIVDFDQAPAQASQKVHDWVKQSAAMIPAFYPFQDTRFVLGEAIRLNATWSTAFDPALTETADFELLDRWSAVPVRFMQRSGVVPYSAGEGYVALALPLQGDQQFLVVLPDSGRFAEVQASLTPERLNGIAAALTPAQISLAVPKFSIETKMQINAGVAAAKGLADFSGLDGSKDLCLSDTDHQSVLLVAEEGLRARSTTLLALEDTRPDTWTGSNGFIITSGTGVFSGPTTDVVLGRPFIFAVRDSATGTILFLGRLTDPQPL